MRAISLFTGIGGFDLAAEWVWWKVIVQCENDPFCQKVLRYHFPDAELVGDIKTQDFKKYANKTDVLFGGFPCQPFSHAGQRTGVSDDRYLWPEMRRAYGNAVAPQLMMIPFKIIDLYERLIKRTNY